MPERAGSAVVGCVRRHGFDYAEFPAYLIALWCLGFAAWLAAQSSRASWWLPAVIALASCWLLARLVIGRITRPTRVTLDARAGAITFENCCFRQGLWHFTRPLLVRMQVAEVRSAQLRIRRFSIGFIGNSSITAGRLTLRTAQGTVRFGPGMRNVQQLGEAIQRMLPARRCASCGYDLRGNTTGRCPECGLKIVR